VDLEVPENKIKYLTIEDVCDMLKIGKSSTYKLFRLKGFPSIKIGNKYIVEEKELLDFLSGYKGSRIFLN
jgi:excisionase family DNA binding protein